VLAFLYPTYYTEKEPPIIKEDELLSFKNNKWQVKKDYYKKQVYNIVTKEIVVLESHDLPENCIEELPKTRYDIC
jgi:hypothetical protein